MQNQHFQKNKIAFPYKGGIHFFDAEQIIRLEANSNYTYIHVRDQRPILMAKVLSDYESLLQSFGFIRIHRSHLVNTRHIQHVRDENFVIMDDQSVAGISRRRRKEVLRMLHYSPNAA